MLLTVNSSSNPVKFNLPTSPDQLISVLGALGRILLVILATYFVARIASGRLRSGLERAGMGSSAAILLSRALWVLVWSVGVLYILYRDNTGLTPLSAFIGVVGLAASLSLQTVLQNLVAGVYLLAERPFAIGDTIAVIGPQGLNHEGIVEDIQMRTTQLRTADDELILVPNAAIFSGVITNRTAVGGYVKQLCVTFPRDAAPEGVRDRLVALLQGQPTVLTKPAPQMRVDKVGKEDWTGSVSFWASTAETDGDIAWAIANAFPEATVNDGDTVPA